MPFLTDSRPDPRIDGRQSARALEVRRGVRRMAAAGGHSVLCEVALPSGRRADMCLLDGDGMFTIVEIKSSLADLRADRKWPDYLRHCDRFFFATHLDVPQTPFPAEHGLIIADAFGAEIVRDSAVSKLPGATRRAMLLKFAHLAAVRLAQVEGLEHETLLPLGFGEAAEVFR